MATILLGWEFGAGRGHAVALEQIATAFAERGHEPVLAVQNVSFFNSGFPVFQAPISPRLLVSSSRAAGASPSGMGEILARLGCDDPGIVAALVRTWIELLERVRPDLVVGDFAPFLLMAAKGRCPTVCFGTGFTAPPSDMPAFRGLSGAPAAADEQAMLASLNMGLATAGLASLRSAPSIFEADASVAATFTELDPYRSCRSAPVQPPVLSEQVLGEVGSGDEVFVYLPENVGPRAPVWEGLRRSNLPVRVYLPQASAAHLSLFEQAGFSVEREPLPFQAIAQRSRLLVSHGGHGFICSGFLAGLPQVIVYYDLEKRLHGNAVAAMGLGGHARLTDIQPDAFAASLALLYQDSRLAERARAAAPEFRARMTKTLGEILCGEAERLLRA